MLLIKEKRHLKTRLPLALLIIFLISISPIIIGIAGTIYVQYTTGQPCHEGNCTWAVMFWLFFYSAPFGLFLFFILAGIVVYDLISLKKS